MAQEDVLVRIGATSKALDAAMARTRASVRTSAAGIGGDLQGLDQRVARAMDGMSRRVRALQRGLAVLTGATGLGLLVKRALDAADSVDKTSQAAGVGVERLQSLRYAAEQTGVGAAGLDDAMVRLNRRLGEFTTTGKGPAADAFRRLGLDSDIASGKIRTAEQAFDAIVKRWAAIPDAAQRAALAAKLFGDDAGPKMALLLNQGEAAIASLEDRARRLGLVLSNETVKAAVEAKDQLETLGAVLKTKLIAAVLDAINWLKSLNDELRIFAVRLGLLADLDLHANEQLVQIERLTERLADLDRQLELMRRRAESARGPVGIPRQFKDEIARLEAERAALSARIDALRVAAARRGHLFGGDLGEPPRAGPGTGAPPPGPSEELVKFLEKLTKMTGDLRLEADLLARDWPEAFGAVARAARDAGLIETLDGLGALTEDARKAVNAYLGEWNRAQALKDAAKVIAETTTEQEKLTTELARLDELRPWLPVETYDRALTGLLDKMRAANPLLARLTAEHDALAASFRGLNPILEDSLKRYDAWKRELESPFEFADRMRREWQTMEDTLRQAGLDVDPALKARFTFDLDEQVMSRLGERTKDAADGMRDFEQAGRDAAQAIGTAFEDAVLSGQNAADVLKALYMDVSRIGLRLFVTKPLEALAGRVAGQAGSLFGGGGGGGGGIRLFQHGGRARAGETILVGERRPEIIRLDAPGTVFPSVAAGMRGGAGGSTQPVVNNYFNIATPDADSFRRAQGNIMAAGFRQAGRESRRRN